MPDDLPQAFHPLPFAQVQEIVELLCLELAAPGDEPVPPLVAEFLRQVDELDGDAAARVSLMLAAASLRAADLCSHPLRAQASIALVQAQALCPTSERPTDSGEEATTTTGASWSPHRLTRGMDEALDFLIDAIEGREDDEGMDYLRGVARLCALVHGRLTDLEHPNQSAAAMLLQTASAIMASK